MKKISFAADLLMNKSVKTLIKARIITLGCKVNQYESDTIMGKLVQNGFKPADKDENPDLMIINTCAVTHKAVLQAKQAIRKAIRENPEAIVCATGCYVQSEPHEMSKINGTDYIIGNSHKELLPEILSSTQLCKKKSPCILCDNISDHRIFEKSSVCSTGNRARPFIKIQDGCNAFCTYCIVPYTRGLSRSRPMMDIMDEIRYISSTGAHEIVLTGIHIGRYGADLTPQLSLLDLLNMILANEKLHARIRLSSIEPTELIDDILQLSARWQKICPHFHIPLQSGDPQILKKMNRPYSPQFFKSLIEKVHQFLPHAAIGVDVMVGFPGETDEAFAHTAHLVESLPISYLHVFPYSRRQLTPASKFPDQIEPDVIKSRFNILRQISQKKKEQFYQQNIGQTLGVIAETKRDKATGFLKGVSENYVKVFFAGDDRLKNHLVQCQISELLSNGAAFGKVIV
jgi:threonylcarbamoyladenosine tRNA methylthiotransferase MtaB